ncbi:MAG: efflux RND transporter periplasmic adaptor subunit [Clostridia bacterium]|nr:efflux RND transporter periplasmic adaptor subunit [Clostridia bacterium]
MKKYVWLAVGVCVAIAAIFAVRSATVPKEITVSLVTLEPATLQHTVTCTGKVEAGEQRDVFVEMPCVTKEIFVKEGQTVKAGDVLFSIDTAATQAVLSQLVPSLNGGIGDLKETVTAPVAGTVASVDVQTGEVADHTKPCVSIAAEDAVQVTVAIRERHLPRVSIGQSATVTGVAFLQDRYAGEVVAIADTAHQEYVGTVSETVVDAVIALDAGVADESLRTGLNAQVEILTGVTENVLLIPYDCLAQTEEGDDCVYVYNADGEAVRRLIEVDGEYADGVLVVSGVSAGERLVQAAETLSGARVRVRAG